MSFTEKKGSEYPALPMHHQPCALCRRLERLTFHHLIPVAVHRKQRYISSYGKEEMRTRGLMICQLCHSGIHDLFPDEKQLADSYNTLELLGSEPRMAKHIAWVKKQKSTLPTPTLES